MTRVLEERSRISALADLAAKIMHQMLFALNLNDSDVRRAYDATTNLVNFRSKTIDFCKYGQRKSNYR